MAALSARTMIGAVLVLWWCLNSAEAGVPGCQPPEVNFLSKVTFNMEMTALPDNAPSETQEISLYPAGTEASYWCDPGFILVGDKRRVCREERWSGAAPHCYLNVAERSSLAINHNLMADGNTSSYEFLLNLFSSESNFLSINLYFPTRILQVRMVADKGIEGIKMKIDFMKSNATVFGSTPTLHASIHHGSSGDLAEYIVFDDIRRKAPEADTLSMSLTGLGERFQPPTGVKLYELQIVADSTGLSWFQCLDDVGSDFIPTQMNTWAYGDWCYHLVDGTENQQDAEKQCFSLGENGTLYRPVTGLSDMTIDKLSVLGLFRQETRSKKYIWIHGQEANQSNDDQASSGASESHRCRKLSLHTNKFICSKCEEQHPFICQRAPRLCGRFPRKAELRYTPSEQSGHLRGHTINVTCDDPGRITGQIRCLAPGWSPSDFCSPLLQSGDQPPRQKPPGRYLAAILGGAVGGVIVLALLTLIIIRGRNGRRERQRQKQYVPPLDEDSEFLALKPNPIYGESSNDDENLYSEVSDPEAIYEECSYAAPLKRPPSPAPPPLPATRPSVGSLVTTTMPASPDLDYEVFPMATADPQPKPPHSAFPFTAAATPAPPVQLDPDYEAFPVDPLMLADGAAGSAPAAPSSPPPAVPGGSRPPTPEYAVPLVGGRPPGGREQNSSITKRPVDVPHVSVGEDEDEYALPCRAQTNAGSARRSIPDVAMVAVGPRVSRVLVRQEACDRQLPTEPAPRP